jgi:hypothetical protein
MSLIPWQQLDAAEIRRMFGTTTVHEKPLAFRAPDGEHHLVLRGELEGEGDESLWWSLCRAESGESVELARNYGVEEIDGDVVEISWDGLFPSEWVDAFASGASDWIRISVTEILEKFGDTVEFEQPQAWRHRSGEFYLVLLGDSDEETQEEEYAWSMVQERGGEYVEIAECHPGNDFGIEELDALSVATDAPDAPLQAREEMTIPGASAEPDSILDEQDEEELFDGWWEVTPFEWGNHMVAALEGAS